MKDTIKFSNTYKTLSVKEKNLFTEYLHPILFLTFNGDLLPFCLIQVAMKPFLAVLFLSVTNQFLKKHPIALRLKKLQALVAKSSTSQSITMDNLSLNLNAFKFNLKNLETNKDQYHRFGKEFYGNFGKDALAQFSKVVISFKGNYLEFAE